MHRALLLVPFLLACARVPMPPGPMGVVRAVPPPVVASLSAPAEAALPEAVTGPDRLGSRPYAFRLADAARRLLDGPYPNGFRGDCSGFVCAAGDAAGARLPPTTATLWDAAVEAGAVHRRKIPREGDLVFFDDTWDRNGNRRLDDDLTHVGVVIDVEADGTAVVAHHGTSRGRAILRLNLRRAHDHTDEDGKILNDFLRRRTRRDRPGTRYLAGELWRGWATVDDRALDAWDPG